MTMTEIRPDQPRTPASAADLPAAIHDQPVTLPDPRGPVSAALFATLRGPAAGEAVVDLTWRGAREDAPTDDDLQLALWCSYELHYRGLAAVDAEWEWHPGLIAARRGWEQHLVTALRKATASDDGPVTAHDVPRRLWDLAGQRVRPSLSAIIMRDATAAQFTEFLIHRSIYHLKEADPHTWGIPRLSGPVKAALVTIQADEYGGGVTSGMHAQLFRTLMESWGLDSRYGGYLDRVPAVTLLTSNLASLFGLHRRWRGALVGHLALFEMTSSVPNARYALGHRRLGGSEPAARFFDEHVVADAVHEQVAAYDLAGGLARAEPGLGGDIVFGAQCAAYADALSARLVAERWSLGLSSLLAEVVA